MDSDLPLPKGVDLKVLLETLRNLSWGAADILRAYARGEQPPFGFSRTFNVNALDKGPVSTADLAVNNWLLKGFSLKFKNIDWAVISEESTGGISNNVDSDSYDWVWLIDPLDGTKDFIQGTGDYAIHLGLLYKGRPILGVVVIPESEELWFGVVGLGAWCENRSKGKTNSSFSNRKELADLILISSRNHRDQKLENLLSGFVLGGKKVKGSVGCKVVNILKGESDFYISLSGQTSPKDWDMAGPEALLISAGGRFTHVNGQELIYLSYDFSQKGCIVASHGKSHELICNSLKTKISK